MVALVSVDRVIYFATTLETNQQKVYDTYIQRALESFINHPPIPSATVRVFNEQLDSRFSLRPSRANRKLAIGSTCLQDLDAPETRPFRRYINSLKGIWGTDIGTRV